MASEELFEAEFSEEQDLEHQQAMETIYFSNGEDS